MDYFDTIRTPDYDPENPRCDEEQHKFIKECIAGGAEGIEKWNQWRTNKRIPEICILAGSSDKEPHNIILDPFSGSGTTLSVALNLGRRAIGIELNEEYIEIAKRRIDREVNKTGRLEM